MARRPHKRVVFRDKKGRYVAEEFRYKGKVDRVQRFVRGRYVDVMEDMSGQKILPRQLQNVLNVPEFERLHEATEPIKSYKSKNKYALFDIARKMDRTKGIRRKHIKIHMTVKEGRKLKRISIYHYVHKNRPQNLHLWKRMSNALGMIGHFVSDPKFGSKPVFDKSENKLKLINVTVEEVL